MESGIANILARIEGSIAEIKLDLEAIKVEQTRQNVVLAGDGADKIGMGTKLKLVEKDIEAIKNVVKFASMIGTVPITVLIGMAINNIFTKMSGPPGH